MDAHLGLGVFGLVFYLGKYLAKHVGLEGHLGALGGVLKGLPAPVMMLLMAIPEQLVMAAFSPKMAIGKRLLVSVAMYVIHFAWNGAVGKPEKSYNELAWIVGTAYYAYRILKVGRRTAVALAAADSVMTLALRGL